MVSSNWLELLTETVCVHCAVLLHASVAVQVIVVVPGGYGALSGWLSLRTPFTVGAGMQLSVAVAVPGLTLAVHEPAVANAVTFGGQEIPGGVSSLTVMVCVRGVELPHPSATV